MRKLMRNSSGQMLIVAALAVALLISSTTVYVYETSRETHDVCSNDVKDFVAALKQCTKNAVTESLSNISNGGEHGVLTTDLQQLSETFAKLRSQGFCQLNFTVQNDSRYDSGVWLSSESSDWGVSSACVDFRLEVSGDVRVVNAYTVNVTTSITVNGSYVRLVGDEKLVNLTVKMFNEEKPALAQGMSFLYENLGNWTPVDSINDLVVIGYGNGTYAVSFRVSAPSEQVPVSVNASDLRGVLVKADIACLER